MSKRGTTSQLEIPGWYLNFLAGVIPALPRPPLLEREVAMDWINNRRDELSAKLANVFISAAKPRDAYNFTSGVRESLRMAREEAARLHHEYVGTEHVLLGLIKVNLESVPCIALRRLGVDPIGLIANVESQVNPPQESPRVDADLPYTSRTKKVLELAMSIARKFQNDYVGVEHLFLGLLLEGKGIAAQVLHEYGIGEENATEQILILLGRG